MYGRVTDDPYKPPAKLPRAKAPAWSYAFRDPKGRTTTLKVLLWIGAAVAVVALISDFMTLLFLSRYLPGGGGWQANQFRQALVGGCQWLLLAITAVVFLMWVHRANTNARLLGAEMKFTPGWAVGWFFIPIWNLWKPYQIMREIWRASQEGAGQRKPNDLLVAWWMLFLTTHILWQIAGRVELAALRQAAEGPLQFASLMYLLTDILQVTLCIVAAALVSSICRLQLEWLARRKAAAEEELRARGQGERNPDGS